ncbi:App1 family protein [Micrococcus lylae]|uniref:App1 family protein n=1 Tax=Micrococcus lylae TaxID=1273 RepID=UPI000C807937|nr:phosphatase domain-containing protein [Micrococcus lylae]WIK82259.1 DUF2183 domain-containing protein [Micrococcus lylae]
MSAPDPHATASPSARTEALGEDQAAHKVASGQSSSEHASSEQAAPEHASAPGSSLPGKRKKGEHIAVRLQNRWNVWQRGRAERRGHVPTAIAFTGYGTTEWVRVLSRVIVAPDEDFLNGRRVHQVVADGIRGWRNFSSPPMAGAQVQVTVKGQVHTVTTDRMGVVDAVIPASLKPGWRTVTLTVGDDEVVSSDVYITDPSADVGMVSDIDDTVLVTALPRPMLAAWNSFVLDEHARTPTPGMAVLLRRIAAANPMAPMLYLSTGAWNVAQMLTRFLGRNLYPLGPLLLTSWGPTQDRWFRSGQEHKFAQLERLAEEFPHIKWILIGDDGQHDPEIYADFAKRHPDRVKAIVIRQLTPSEALLAGGRVQHTRHSTPGVPWCYGPDGAALASQLEELGILETEFVDVRPEGWKNEIEGLEEE